MTDIQRLINTNSLILCKTSEEWDNLSKLTNNKNINHFHSSILHLFNLKQIGNYFVPGVYFDQIISFYTQYNYEDFDKNGNFTKNYLLKEVEKRYPIGTKVKPVIEKAGHPYISDNIEVVKGNYYWANGCNAPSCKSFNNSYLALYKKGVWAKKIIELPKTEFQIGKWYKNLGKDDKCYAKCSKFENDRFFISDIINHKKEYTLYSGDTHFTTLFTKENYIKAELLTDLSEIQEFLPDGHIDKIKNEFPNEGCVYGDINDLTSIVRYLLNRPGQRHTDHTITKCEAIGLGWNNNSCWWLKTKKSEKKEYKLFYLKKILNINQDYFVLPEKWCFKVNDENYSKFKHLRPLFSISGYITSIPYNALSWGRLSIDVYGEEITFEQFEKYVLKESNIVDTDPFIECEECNGQGTVLVAKLYPNGHCEESDTCSVCNGDGEIVHHIEIDEMSSELIIPQIIKPKSQINYNLNLELPKLELNLPKNQTKQITQIILKPYSIII
jgi:hypothetical protein